MKHWILIAILAVTSASFAQKIKLRVEGQKDTTVFLVKYFGKSLYYADTAEMKNGYVEFDGSKQQAGVMALLLPGTKYFEFLHNNEPEVYLETKGPDYTENLKVKKSIENKIFIDFIHYITPRKKEINDLSNEKKPLKEDDLRAKEITKRIDQLNKEVIDYQNKLITEHSTKLVGKLIKMTIDPVIPEETHYNADGTVDSLFKYRYFQKHYWDNMDLNDDRLTNSAIFHNKLEFFFSKTMMIQHWDTVLYYAYQLCDRLNPTSKTFEYCVSWITSSYGKSNIMGIDKVYIMMLDRYYCSKNSQGKSPAFWVTPEKLEDLCEKVPYQKNTIMGVRPPNLILRDTSDTKWHDFYSLKSEYTILYFWDPECGHCKQTTPKLERLYKEKFKARNIEVFAVGKAVGEEFKKWKKYIADNNLTFINVAVTEPLFQAAMKDAREFVPKYTTLESLNYAQTYDIYSTPRVFILDKDKKIIAKGLSISQLEEMMDRYQGKADLPKIFPPDPKEDEQMH